MPQNQTLASNEQIIAQRELNQYVEAQANTAFLAQLRGDGQSFA
ncbi:hypothetical protein [Scytonema sp. UIC 10036]|nr:hypothetical protein [Scytonema sp. UIC 10036]